MKRVDVIDRQGEVLGTLAVPDATPDFGPVEFVVMKPRNSDVRRCLISSPTRVVLQMGVRNGTLVLRLGSLPLDALHRIPAFIERNV